MLYGPLDPFPVETRLLPDEFLSEWGRNRSGRPTLFTGITMPSSERISMTPLPNPPMAVFSSNVENPLRAAGHIDQHLPVHGLHEPAVDHRAADSFLLFKLFGGSETRVDHRAAADQADIRPLSQDLPCAEGYLRELARERERRTLLPEDNGSPWSARRREAE